jgi:hypothetical protein
VNNPKSSKEKWKTAIWIIVAAIAVISFIATKVISFLDMAQDMN